MFSVFVSFVASSSGCRITNCEHGSVCSVDDEEARDNACRSLCDRLVVCGEIGGDDHDTCMSSCVEDYDHAPASTSNACRCVARASCSEVADRRCSGAPIIGGTGSGSSTVTGAGTVTGTGAATGAGTVTGAGT